MSGRRSIAAVGAVALAALALLTQCTYHLDVEHAAKDLVFDVTYAPCGDAGLRLDASRD